MNPDTQRAIIIIIVKYAKKTPLGKPVMLDLKYISTKYKEISVRKRNKR